MKQALSIIALCATFLAGGRSAAADCLSPTIELTHHDVAPGDYLTFVGSYWGDNCYDIGLPPDGEGILGVPIDGIEIFIVQGDDEWLVATGAADAAYAFEVTVVAPSELATGVAEVQARWGAQGLAYSQDPRFTVIDAPPSTVIESTVESFGPGDESTTAPIPASPISVAPAESNGTTFPLTTITNTPQSTAVDTATGQQDTGDTASVPTSLIMVSILVVLVGVGAALTLVRRRRMKHP